MYLFLVYFFRINYDGVLLRCLPVEKLHEIPKEMHDGVCEVHFAPKVISHQIIKDGYYWPSIFKESLSFIKKCITYEEGYHALTTNHGRCTIYAIGVGCY